MLSTKSSSRSVLQERPYSGDQDTLLQERPYSGEQDWINLISSSAKYFNTIVFHKICLDLTKDPWWWNVVLHVLYTTHLNTVGVYLVTLPKDTATVNLIITIAHWFCKRRFLRGLLSATCLYSVPGPAGHIVPPYIQYLDLPDTYLHPLFYIQDSPHS